MTCFELLMPKCFPHLERIQLLHLVKILADVALVVHLNGGQSGKEVLHCHQSILQPIPQNLRMF